MNCQMSSILILLLILQALQGREIKTGQSIIWQMLRMEVCVAMQMTPP